MYRLLLLTALLLLFAVPLSTACETCDCEDETCITLEILPYCEMEWEWIFEFDVLEGGEGTVTECVDWHASSNHASVITCDDDLPDIGEWETNWTDVYFGPGEVDGEFCVTFTWDINDPAGVYDGCLVLCVSDDD